MQQFGPEITLDDPAFVDPSARLPKAEFRLPFTLLTSA